MTVAEVLAAFRELSDPDKVAFLQELRVELVAEVAQKADDAATEAIGDGDFRR